jgi:histidinol-phosphate aminotransferase
VNRKPFDMRAMIRPDLLELPGYLPITPTDVLAERLGIAPEDVIKLDGNENLFGPSPKALAAIAGERAYHIYPDPDQHRVRAALARFLGVEAERIVCGLGSDDLIDLVLRAVVSPGDGVINCPPTFGMYPFSTEIAGGRVIDVPRQETFALDVPAIEKAAPGAKLIFLASPNNPTGNRLSPAGAERLLGDRSATVVDDEAYMISPGAALIMRLSSWSSTRTCVAADVQQVGGRGGLRAGYTRHHVITVANCLCRCASIIKQLYTPATIAAAGVAMRCASLERSGSAGALDERRARRRAPEVVGARGLARRRCAPGDGLLLDHAYPREGRTSARLA